jgi:hypothetical protein
MLIRNYNYVFIVLVFILLPSILYAQENGFLSGDQDLINSHIIYNDSEDL